MPLVSCVWKWIGMPISCLQRLHQRLGRIGLAQAGHIFDGQDVRAHLFQLFGQLDVILQIVFGRLGSRMSPV